MPQKEFHPLLKQPCSIPFYNSLNIKRQMASLFCLLRCKKQLVNQQFIIFNKTFGYLANNSLICTAFAQSLSREELLGMLRCIDKTI